MRARRSKNGTATVMVGLSSLTAVCGELVSSRYLLQEDADTLSRRPGDSWDVFEVI